MTDTSGRTFKHRLQRWLGIDTSPMTIRELDRYLTDQCWNIAWSRVECGRPLSAQLENKYYQYHDLRNLLREDPRSAPAVAAQANLDRRRPITLTDATELLVIQDGPAAQDRIG